MCVVRRAMREQPDHESEGVRHRQYAVRPVRHMVGVIMDSWYMIFPSALLAWVLEYTGAHAEAFVTWCVLSAADLVIGTIVAVVQGVFKASRLYHWVEKTFVQLLSVFIFAAVLRTLAIASGVELFVANWLLLFYCFLDASSLLEKFVQMGWMPSVALVLLKFMRRRTTNAFAAMAGDPKLAAEMEKALVESPVSPVGGVPSGASCPLGSKAQAADRNRDRHLYVTDEEQEVLTSPPHVQPPQAL